MIGSVIRLAVVAVCLFGGWMIGSVYPAPDFLVEKFGPQAVKERALAKLKSIDWAEIKNNLPKEQAKALTQDAVRAAVAAGSAVAVERTGSTMTSDGETVAAVALQQAFETALTLCPGMTVSNAPRAGAGRQVAGFTQTTNIQGVAVAVNPTRGACLSSGFGARGSRQHRGVDYYSPTGGPILAAAGGTVIEQKYRDDYGNMLLIDHGNGVYTRYAHLSSFQPGLSVGKTVQAGDLLGLMGNTAGYPIPIHLHYEVLVGDYANPKASFGLEPRDPLAKS